MSNIESSQKSILKSAGLVGASQVVSIVVGIIRTKFVAILLGPSGVGLIGFYQNIIDLVRNFAGLGVNFSGVKEVAQAVSTNNETKISRVSLILLRLSLFTGLIGTILMMVFSKQISIYTFKTTNETSNIILLSICVLFASVSSGQLALLQGMRQLGLMAKASVVSVLVTLFTSIPLFYLMGAKGIVPSLITSGLASLLVTFLYARKIKLQKVKVSIKQVIFEGSTMIKLGFFTVVASLIGMGAMYWVRGYILKQEGMESVGFFNAAWAIGSMYLMLVLNAMGTDYFPRLSGIINNHKQVRMLVNNQTEIALLIGSTVIIALLAFDEVAISIMYSSKFAATQQILKWILVGDFFKLLSWPLGFIVLAKGRGKNYVFMEVIWNSIFISANFLLLPHLGLQSAGIAYCLGNLLNFGIVFFIVNQLVKIRFSKQLKLTTFLYMIGIIALLLTEHIDNMLSRYTLNSLIVLVTILLSLRKLNQYINVRSLLQKFKR